MGTPKMDANQLQQICPDCPDFIGWTDALNDAAFPYAKIGLAVERAAFLAQIGHESGDMRAVVENLNYSADALARLFGKYFPGNLEQQYHRQPERIANRIYANRMGNGPESSGDGWRFRGHGPIQLTGRLNHQQFAFDTGIDIINEPELWDDIHTQAMSAAWWWRKNDANRYAKNVEALSRLVNLGNPKSKAVPHGMEDRRMRFERAKRVLGA